MSAPEFAKLIEVLDRVHKRSLLSHQEMLKNVPQQFAPYVPFYQVNQPTAGGIVNFSDLK